jgi:hypothetical protein
MADHTMGAHGGVGPAVATESFRPGLPRAPHARANRRRRTVPAPRDFSAKFLQLIFQELPGAIDAGFDGFDAASPYFRDFRITHPLIDEQCHGFP